MKRILLNLFAAALILPSAALAQVHDHAEDSKPSYYIDSVLVNPDHLGYINPQNIENVYVVKEGAGAIYINLKEGLTFLTLDEVVFKYLDLLPKHTSSIVYVIDNKVIQKPSEVKIDKSFIKEVKQTSLAEAAYLDDSLRKIRVITIKLSPDGDKKEMRIRGLASANSE